MARAPRQCHDGTLWMGKRVIVKRMGEEVARGTVTQMSDGKDVNMWVRLDSPKGHRLCYARDLEIIE